MISYVDEIIQLQNEKVKLEAFAFFIALAAVVTSTTFISGFIGWGLSMTIRA
jgi:hypothetical protein